MLLEQYLQHRVSGGLIHDLLLKALLLLVVIQETALIAPHLNALPLELVVFLYLLLVVRILNQLKHDSVILHLLVQRTRLDREAPDRKYHLLDGLILNVQLLCAHVMIGAVLLLRNQIYSQTSQLLEQRENIKFLVCQVRQ